MTIFDMAPTGDQTSGLRNLEFGALLEGFKDPISYFEPWGTPKAQNPHKPHEFRV